MLRLGEVGLGPGYAYELRVPLLAIMVDDGDGRDAATLLDGSTLVASDLVSCELAWVKPWALAGACLAGPSAVLG